MHRKLSIHRKRKIMDEGRVFYHGENRGDVFVTGLTLGGVVEFS